MKTPQIRNAFSEAAATASPLLSKIRHSLRAKGIISSAFLSLLLSPAAQVTAATVTTTAKTVPLTLKISSSSVDVTVPAGCTACSVEVRLKGSKKWLRWRTYTFNGKPSSVSLTPPSGNLIAEWRATGSVNAAKAQAALKNTKFPEAFYQGKRKFAKSAASGYVNPSAVSSNSGPLYATSIRTQDTANTATTTATAQVVEADIWKTDGNTIYFFNQLRGLQVLDISDPAKPLLTASLRLPAVGQDLYLLPGQNEGERLVVLLTQSESSSSASDVVVIKVSGKTAQQVSRTTVDGSLGDSRMLGNRLYVASTDWTSLWQPPVGILTTSLSVAGASQQKSTTTLSELQIQPDGSVSTTNTFPISASASSTLISAGSDWLTVSWTTWTGYSPISYIQAFRLGESGATQLTEEPITVAGTIKDKFKTSLQNGVLTAVSESYAIGPNGWSWIPITQLENFDLQGNKLGSLELIRDETLFATRFSQGKLYAVTFKQVDPLWVIDLADPANPTVSGHVEIPGYSTYIQPIGEKGDLLFTIGLDEGKVTASLFDVSDVTAPALKDRVFLNETAWGGYSEAVYDEKALKILEDEGLALIPFSGYRWFNPSSKTSGQSSEKSNFLRLVDINTKDGGSLTLRGRLDHDFAPRRATIVNGVLASISQKELITANIDDRDKPVLLADVALAWPVDQVIQKGDHLLQIAKGVNSIWSGENGTIRVTSPSKESTVLNEVELGEGAVQDAVIRNSKLYVLRNNGGNSGLVYARMAIFGGDGAETQLSLDVYDVSALPAITKLGTVTVNPGTGYGGYQISKLLWVNDSLPAVILQQSPYYWGGPRIMYASRESSGSLVLAPDAVPAPTLLTSSLKMPQAPAAAVLGFDVSNPAAPVALKPFSLESSASTLPAFCAAGDGLLVFSYGKDPAPWKYSWSGYGEQPEFYTHQLGVVDFAKPSAPFLRSPVSLPGKLMGVSEVSRSGFIAYTESFSTANSLSVRQVDANLIDEFQASLIASTEVPNDAVLAINDRNLYVASSQTVSRLNLTDAATFSTTGTAKTDWTPNSLCVRGNTVLGAASPDALYYAGMLRIAPAYDTTDNRLMRVSWPGLTPVVESWKTRTAVDLPSAEVGVDGTIFAPQGEYGVDKYAPSNTP